MNICCNGICQLSTGTYLTCKHIYCTVSAFLTSLPYIDDSLWLILRHPAHINDITHIEDNDSSSAGSAYFRDQLFFRLSQAVASCTCIVILILSCSSSDHYQRDIILSSTFQHFLSYRHFFLTPRNLTPAFSFIERIFLDPSAVDLQKLLVQMKFLIPFQCIQNPYGISGIYQSPGTQSAFIIMKCHTAKNGYFFPYFQRQCLISVLQQYTAFCSCLSGKSRIFFQIQFIIIHVVFSPSFVRIINEFSFHLSRKNIF